MSSSPVGTTESHPATVEDLQWIETFADLPTDGLEWLASRMEVYSFQAGDLVIAAGTPADFMVVVLSGELQGELPDGRVFVARGGRVTGLLPFSRMETFPATVRATEGGRGAVLSKKYFPELQARLPLLQQRLVHVLNDRIRETAAADQQREKMAALGRLSAGLAHELNNPASAARRAADTLRSTLTEVREAALQLDRLGLPYEARVYLAELEMARAKKGGAPCPMDSLERSEKEEEMTDWLDRRRVDQPWNLSASLVDLGFALATMDDIAAHVPEQFLHSVLLRLTAAFNISRLADEIESSTGRISELVQAIKEYSYMDRMPEGEIDVHDGIENTLIMLRHKFKNGPQLVRNYDRSLPKITARGGELNQIWTNLIVNAIDALKGKGTITIITSASNNFLNVEVRDDGPGIPTDVQSHIFEPFFTTKPVGEGTGLGLDAVYRIATNHRGNIIFSSQPGETRFIVKLPLHNGATPSSH